MPDLPSQEVAPHHQDLSGYLHVIAISPWTTGSDQDSGRSPRPIFRPASTVRIWRLPSYQQLSFFGELRQWREQRDISFSPSNSPQNQISSKHLPPQRKS